jgi:hypothetical protein
MLTMWKFPNCSLNTGLESDPSEVKAIADGYFNYSFLYIYFWELLILLLLL